MNKFSKMSTLLMVGIISISSFPLVVLSCNKNDSVSHSTETTSSNAAGDKIDENTGISEPKGDDNSNTQTPTEVMPPVVLVPSTNDSEGGGVKQPFVEPSIIKPPVVVPPKIDSFDKDKLPTITIKPNNLDFVKGGIIPYAHSDEKIIVDKYFEVVKQLNINEYTNTSKLTNEELNNRLHENSKYKELSIKISEGSSQKSGKLFLKLSGKYNEVDIEETVISIANFPTFDFPLRMNSLVNINKNKFIENLKHDNNLNSLNMKEFFEINNSNNLWVLTKTNEVPLNLLTLYQNGFIGRIIITGSNLNGDDWNIAIAFNYKQYDSDNNSWQAESSQTQHLFGYKVNLDINQTALDYLADHSTIQNNSNTSLFASSLFLKERKNLSHWEDYIKIDQKVYDFYFGSETKWEDFQILSNGDLRPDDIKGILEGDFSLTITNGDNGKKYVSSLLEARSIKNFKTASDIFTKDSLSSNKNYMVVGGIFTNTIITDLRMSPNRKALSALKVGESHSFKAKELARSFGRSALEPGTLLFNNNYNESDDFGGNNDFGDLQGLNTSQLSLHILGITSDSLLDLLAHNRDGSIKGMFVRWIIVGLNPSEPVIVTKTKDGFYKVSSKLKISIGFFGAVQEFVLSTTDISIEQRRLDSK